LGDLNYFSDLIYLPFRQLRLFAADLFPASVGLAKDFDPARYRGSSIDTTGSVVLPDGAIKNGELPGAEAEILRGVRKLEAGTHPPILPRNLVDLEFGDERHYTRLIAELAEKNGAKLAFLFLPYYTGPAALENVQERVFYERYGPVLDGGFLARHAEWYADYAHLDRQGADTLTDWLLEPIAHLLKDPKSSP
jgi:hypothetical protein